MTNMIVRARRFDRGDFVYAAYLVLPFRLFLHLGRPVGWLEMLLRPKARHAVRANLEQAFGTTKSRRELSKLTRQVFEYHQMRILMLMVAPLMTARGQLEKYFPIRGVEHLDRALEAGKSAIILGSHINSMALLLALTQLRRAGYPIRVPMPDPHDPWPLTPFRRLIHRLLGAATVVDSIGGFYAQFNVRPLVKVLTEKSILILMGDGWHSASFVDAEFLGRQLPFTSGPLNLARLTGVPVVPIFATGAPDRLEFVLEPAFSVERTNDAQVDVARAVRTFVARVERRMLADIPSWQHWLIDDVFDTLEHWRSRSLHERYNVTATATE